MKKVGGKLNLVKSIKYIILTNDNLERLSNSMGDCKFVEVRVLRENIERVKKHDAKLGSILEELGGFFNSNYYTLRLRLDYEHHNADNQGIIRKFVKIFASKKEELSAYEKFSVEAVNTSKEERKFEAFDLLVDKVKSIITVQRKLNSKVINTSEMFSLMVDEYTNKIA